MTKTANCKGGGSGNGNKQSGMKNDKRMTNHMKQNMKGQKSKKSK